MTRDVTAVLDLVQSRLKDGLHLESVRSMRDATMRLAQATEAPLALYVLATVLGDLESRWEGRPVPASETSAAEEQLVPLLRRVVFDLKREAPEAELVAAMQKLVATFIELQNSGAIG